MSDWYPFWQIPSLILSDSLCTLWLLLFVHFPVSLWVGVSTKWLMLALHSRPVFVWLHDAYRTFMTYVWKRLWRLIPRITFHKSCFWYPFIPRNVRILTLVVGITLHKCFGRFTAVVMLCDFLNTCLQWSEAVNVDIQTCTWSRFSLLWIISLIAAYVLPSWCRPPLRSWERSHPFL